MVAVLKQSLRLQDSMLVDHVYVLCDPEREPERAAYLRRTLSEPYTFVSKCYGTTLSAADAIKAYDPFQNRAPVERERNFSSHNLKLSEISLLINWHHFATKAVAAGHKYVMMFESDVLFTPSFRTDLETALSLLEPDSFDFLSISALPHLRPSREEGDVAPRWYEARGYYKTRTCDAMIFSVPMLERISKTFFPCADVLDWELNYQLNLHRARCFWLDPPIITQGSGSGVYPTTLV